ncbi:heat stress transcription factor B-4-like protein [Tanacetum coccineum]|uniref:Heat stress transcription factor B-4-like protein n=1 Tax=Tanacetum coccineum TaxID=301880 RepID=A0ABQ5BQH3_9ASTR
MDDPQKQWMGTTDQLIKDLEVAYGYTGKSEPMFDNYLRPLTSLDEGLYALACEEDVRCLATLVRSFKLIEVYIEHGVTALDSYLRASRGTTKEPVCDSVTPSSLPQHDSSTPCKDSVYESITPRCMHDCILTPPADEPVIAYTQLSGVLEVDTQSHVLLTIQSQFTDINLSFVSQQATTSMFIDDVIRQLSFDETELDGEAGFADVARNGVDSSWLSHDESFRVDNLDLNLNKPVNLNVSQDETQSELLVSEEPDGGNGQEDESALTDEQFFYDDEGIDTTYETKYDVQSSEDAGTDDDDDDDDDVDEDFLVDEENEILEPDVDVHLFGISMDLPFDNIGVTNLVLDDVLEGEDVDVINADDFDSDLGNDEEKNYRKRRRNLKLYKNDGVRIRARCDGKVPVFTMSQELKLKQREIRGDHVFQYSMLRDYVVELQSTNPNTTVKIAVERNTNPSLPTRVFQRIYVCLGALKLSFRARRRDLLGLVGAFIKGSFPGQVLVAVGLDSNNGIYPLAYALVEAESKSSWCWFLQCLGDDIDLHPNSNFTFISDRQKGIIPAIKTVYPTASAINVRDFEKCMLELKTMNPKAHEWLNKIPAKHWARSYFSGRAKSDLLLNNICEVFNGKIVKGRDKPVITLLEYIREYFMKRIVNVQACWNMALNDRATPPPETWVGRQRKKRKRSKHKDEPFVKDGKLSRKGRTITCQSCGNTGHNKETCKGQGRKATTGGNNAEASGIASRQVQQTEPTVGQDGSSGSGAGAVIGLSAAAGECGAGGPGGAGVASQVYPIVDGQREEYKQKELVHKKELPLNLLPVLKCQ